MGHEHISNKSRRAFLRQLGCAGLGMTTFLSGITNLGLMNAAAKANMPMYAPLSSIPYKALVCLNLAGGNDSFNMLVPRGTSEYAEYAAVRSNQALPQSSLLPVSHLTSDGKQYGLHPNLSFVKTLFDSGNAAFVANVGALVQPVTVQEVWNNNNVPLGLGSHSDQSLHWQTSIPQVRTNVGWGGRLGEILSTANTNDDISLNISLGGTNVFQNGNNSTAYSIEYEGNGSTLINGYDETDFFNVLKRQTLDNILDQNYQNILRQGYADIITDSKSNAIQFDSALASVAPFSTNFNSDILSQKMQMVAKTIAARTTLGMSRQVFYVDLDGFDNHDEVLTNHGYLMTEVNAAIESFYNVLVEMGMQNQVTLFTMSEFGRTLTSNGNGTDHGWGGNCLVMGGAVNGQDIYGQYPDLYLGNAIDTGDGVLIPSTSCDEYFAELALWFADNGTSTLSTTQLTDIFPNIANFWSPIVGNSPLGFMSV